MKYPQKSYATVVRDIQSEWIFVQRVTNNKGDKFEGVKKLLWGNIFPILFFRKAKYLTPFIGSLSMMPVKKVGLGIQNPVTFVDEKYLSSQRASTEMIQAVMGEGGFSTANILLALRE